VAGQKNQLLSSPLYCLSHILWLPNRSPTLFSGACLPGCHVLSPFTGALCEGPAWDQKNRKYMLFAGSLISAVLAMLTKENAFTLPFSIVLFEISFSGRRKLQ